jgi:hypothetical protein
MACTPSSAGSGRPGGAADPLLFLADVGVLEARQFRDMSLAPPLPNATGRFPAGPDGFLQLGKTRFEAVEMRVSQLPYGFRS